MVGHRKAVAVAGRGWAGRLWVSRDDGWSIADQAGDPSVLAGLHDIPLAAG